jgi:peptidoglycan hydrolase CwlO-like protein
MAHKKYMKNITLLSLLALVSCSVFKTNSTYSGLNKLTFTVESKFEQIPEMTNQIETYLENLDSLGLTDSFKIKFQKLMNEKVERELKYLNEIYIEAVGNDWQRQRYMRLLKKGHKNQAVFR